MGASLSAEQAFWELLKHIPELLALPIQATPIPGTSSTSRTSGGIRKMPVTLRNQPEVGCHQSAPVASSSSDFVLACLHPVSGTLPSPAHPSPPPVPRS